MKFKEFTLDKFQEDAISAVEKNHSVLVSSPTGSGKTLIADYIIDRDITQEKRVIYTAPIKALSNQKYKDFTEAYGIEKIGLITGDIVVNSAAPILIMTAEIYRNMTIVKDPMLDDVSYCIMDEVHYISDEERGYIWEESIIFSPPHIRFLFLSATIPNADEFADWVSRIKAHEVSVIKHHIRPVPLDRKFFDVELGITTLEAIKERKELDRYPSFSKGRFRREKLPIPDFKELVFELRKMDKLPCIYFVFSRQKTQDYAVDLSNKYDFLSNKERDDLMMISGIEFRRLSPEILALHTVQELRRCLPRGIAFHNAGMLPDVKHVVEKLFALGLIKVLFATETFAVGINMPAKTVCFDNLRKFTKTGFRYLTSKEYFQISGRAGRRGIDTEGLSVSVIHRPAAELDKIALFTKEDVLPLKSQFRLTYNTILNMVNLHTPEENQRILTMNLFTHQALKGKVNSNRVLGSIKARFTKIVKTLTHEGYIKDGELTALGLFATKIFSNELEISQIFVGDFRYQLEEYSVLLMIAALVYEGKGDVKFQKMYDVPPKLLNAINSNPILHRGEWHENLLKMTAIMHPCYHQKKFMEILEHVSMPEGDLIRLMMRIMDKLEQIEKAIMENEEQKNMIRNCKMLIRDSLEGIHVF